VEAGALASDAGDSGAVLFDRAECSRLCGTGNWISCSRTEVSGVPMIRCNHDCTGRRPSGLRPSELSGGAELGSYFAEMARLEAASVFAFRELRVELRAHGAPRALVRAAQRAARDEVRHARATRALARRYGGDVRSPHVEGRPVRSLEAIALDNAVEGCVRETFGALVAHHQARAAQDPVVAATMARIARDETRHAALAHDIDAWVKRRLGPLARRRVDAAKRDGYRALLSRKIPDAADPILGLPGASAGRVLIEQLMAALVPSA
jgi:hypothetical protein